MRFTPFPDDEVEFHGGARIRFAGPPDSGVGDLDVMMRSIRTAEGFEGQAFSARVELEDGDLELLQAGHPIYITQYGGVIPIAVDIPAERVEIPDTAQAWIDGYREGLSG